MEEKVRRKDSTGISAKYFRTQKNVTELPVFFVERFRRNPFLRFQNSKAYPFLLESRHFKTHI